MNKIYNSPIFKGLSSSEIDILLAGKCRITNYKTGELIAVQGSRYQSFLIVDRGMVRGEMANHTGNNVTIEEIAAPRAIAPAILFATENRLPVSVIAVTECDIVSIKASDFTEIMQSDSRILHNFMRSISDRSKFLSDKVRVMSFGTIKSKLADYLLRQMNHSQSDEFDIPHTQQEIADMFGVSRPSLSRAISQMAEEGIIESKKNHFHIKEKGKLKQTTNTNKS